MKVKLLSLLLILTLLVTGCANTQQESTIADRVKDAAQRYSFLVAGKNCALTTLDIFGYYNSVSYNKARDKAKISPTVEAVYFPSVNWSGSEFLSGEKYVELINISLESVTDTHQVFVVWLNVVKSETGAMTYMFERMTYNPDTDQIIKIEDIAQYSH